MIQLSWGTVVSFALLVIAFGPSMLYVGRYLKQIDCNTSAIERIDKKLDVIQSFIKNGRK